MRQKRLGRERGVAGPGRVVKPGLDRVSVPIPGEGRFSLRQGVEQRLRQARAVQVQGRDRVEQRARGRLDIFMPAAVARPGREQGVAHEFPVTEVRESRPCHRGGTR